MSNRRDTSLGPRVRRLRKARGLTMEELSGRVGLTPNSLNRIELEKSEASLATRRRLAKYFGLTLDELEGAASLEDPPTVQSITALARRLNPRLQQVVERLINDLVENQEPRP